MGIRNYLTRAFALPPGQKESQIRTVTASDAAQPWWGLQPLDATAYAMRLCANDRLVELIAKDWDPILREQPDENDDVGQYPMFVGKVEGKWAILL